MKLVAIYNVFDGEELLEGSISQIRNDVDLIIAISQTTGNFGEQYNDGHSKCLELKSKGLIDIVELYTPILTSKGSNGTKNELKKRQRGLDIARQEKGTHFLFVDCDEFYKQEEFKRAKEHILANNFEGTVLSMVTYYKFPNWQIEGLENYYVPFIHKISDNLVCGVESYPFTADPTRRVNITNITALEPEICTMHHFSWVRKNLERKINNSSCNTYLNKNRTKLLNDYNNARPGRSLQHWNNKIIINTKNHFNINIGEHLINKNEIKICIKFPTRSRPEKFFNVLDIYLSKMNNKDNYYIIVSCDTDDITMNNPETISRLQSYKNLSYFFQNNKNKIEAVNANIHKDLNFDVLLLASDDMIPKVQGYDDAIREQLYNSFPDTDGVVWFNDGYQGEALNTLCILGKKYFERFNYIYHPSYKSLWCDTEFTEVSKKLDKYVYSNEIIISHEHPVTKRENTMEDELLIKNDSYNETDRLNFEKRKKINFDLPIIKPSILKKFKSLFSKSS